MGQASSENDVLTKENKDLGIDKQGKDLYFISKFFFGTIIIIFSLVIGFQLFTNTQAITDLVQDSGSVGAVVYLSILSCAIVMLFPTPILKIFSGTFFGFTVGLLINFLASMLGGLLAFLIGRYFFRDLISKSIKKNKITKEIERSMEIDGFKLSFFIRLSPLIPDEWLNYTLSVSPISTKTFILSNCSSIIYSLIYAYYGAVLGKVVLTQSGLIETNYSLIDWILIVLGVIATIISILIITKISKNSYENATSKID
ncbi:MAG: hypothetical protein CMB56_004880 [Methanobacteriota archaeon]|nr:MAG: hypothetical protein CMB56_004880 [Euryarchaeota archaeon]